MGTVTMYFHHLHFYVRDAAAWKEWFIQKLGFELIAVTVDAEERAGELTPVQLQQDGIEIWLSDAEHSTSARQYLRQHPPGLVDIAFATDQFDTVVKRARQQGAQFLTPVTAYGHNQRHCQIAGWADIRHTVLEVSAQWIGEHQPHIPTHLPSTAQSPSQPTGNLSQRAQTAWLSFIDHVVINVPQGELRAAVTWYQRVFGLQQGQSFEITTDHSGLCSQVLIHPEGTLQLPINEPSSANSQVQEFLHHNRGAGVQHVALRSQNAVGAIAHFRHQGLKLINVPQTYYDKLHDRPGCPLHDLSAVSRQQLLLDWKPSGEEGMLLQTFTEPIFGEPTFFFEIIERGQYYRDGQTKTAEGFGEGNFQALFEAIERAQMERGSLERGSLERK